MAAHPPRSSAGCWTCRLRRKKCDETRPVCECCAALEIECVYSVSRPHWMDNGPRQRAMADRLKLVVKDRASWRREKRFLRDIESGAAAISLAEETRPEQEGSGGKIHAGMTHIFSVHGSSATPLTDLRALTGQTEHRPSTTPPAASLSRSGTTLTSPNTSTDESMSSAGRIYSKDTSPSSSSSAAAATAATVNSTSATLWALYDNPEVSLAPPSLDRERELNLMMVYLDYVFPFLYPFCRPTVLSSGRGWLLVLLMKNKAVFHSALSLSSYFMAVVAMTTASLHSGTQHGSSGAGAGAYPPSVPWVSAAVASGGGNHDHSDCLSAVAAELHKQQELSLRELQRTIAGISQCQASQSNMPSSLRTEHLAESARALESILHLLSFEVVLQRFDSWQVHLDAALVLFEQMLQQSSEDAPAGKEAWEHMMDRLSPFDRAALEAQRVPSLMPHGSDQAALKFYASLLFYMDIVTSTITETAPRLQRYHHFLLAPNAVASASGKQLDSTMEDGHFQGPWALPDPAVAMFLHPEEVVGIHSWVLLMLAETAALAAWKKEAMAARRLNVAELLARAAPIEQRLRGQLAALDEKLQRRIATGQNGRQQDPLPSFSLRAGFYSRHIAAGEALAGEILSGQRHPQSQDADTQSPSLPAPAHADGAAHLSVDTASHVWGLGVLTYLLVVVNGWQPEADAVRQAADRTLAELAALPSASCLRVAAWPLCVAGCLATTPQQRALYPGMVGEICGGELFGTVNEALRIMEAVWAAQDLEGGGSGVSKCTEWGFAQCFNILGRRAFLL
ncbi:hypothetical protein SEPCBS57363_000043 [Sporothrix epigloea]|uniref:Zn(2)-C6 fungal-type domain-containing protein n=1 Tax=Sporothrix epigloea TaxID=1892477 RepID=A0ABP0D6A2_9PEZI